MIKINLLPWRQKLRQQRQQEFVGMAVVAALVGAVLTFGAYSAMNKVISNQNARNQMIQNEIRALDRRIERIRELDRRRALLENRIEVIQDLQARRPEAVHLFDQLVLTLPEGTFFRELRQEGARLRLVGRAESNARISALMIRVDDSPWMRDSRLEIIETRQEGRLNVRDFRLEVQQTRPSGSGS